MDLKIGANAVRLLGRIFLSPDTPTPCIPYYPQKPDFDSSLPLEAPFPRVSPRAAGVPGAHLRALVRELSEDPTLDVHTLFALRDGRVILDHAFGAYRTDVWFTTYSLAKTVTGLAIGMLIDEGRLALDDKIVRLLSDRLPPLSSITHKNITVENLLTMTSGVSFGEIGSVTETDWVRGYFESSVRTDGDFAYNSMNSYILSVIVREVSGMPMMEYLTSRLWLPLGITGVAWEKCPAGIEKGGWGLYIRPEDAAKLGQLYLCGGLWNGRRIISEEWIRASMTQHAVAPDNYGGYNYGYHLWCARDGRSFVFNGMFGQNVFLVPETKTVVVTTAGNGETFQSGNLYRKLEKYFTGDIPPYPFRPDFSRLLDPIRRLREERAAARSFAPLDGRCYRLSRTVRGGAATFPLISQILQNNYRTQIDSLAFARGGREYLLTLSERDGTTYELPLGFVRPAYCELDVGGEHYRVGTTAHFADNEDGVPVLTIRLSFIEIANSRIIKVYRYGNNIRVVFSEIPGREFAARIVDEMLEGTTRSRVASILASRFDPDLVLAKLDRAFSETVVGVPDIPEENKTAVD